MKTSSVSFSETLYINQHYFGALRKASEMCTLRGITACYWELGTNFYLVYT